MICSSHWLSHRAWLHGREQFLPSHHWCSRTLGLFQTAYFQAHFISCLWFNHLEKKSGEWRPISGPRGLGENTSAKLMSICLWIGSGRRTPGVHWCWLGPCAAAGGISFFWLPTLDKRKKSRSQLGQSEHTEGGGIFCLLLLLPAVGEVSCRRNSPPGNQQADLGLSRQGLLTVQKWPSNKVVSIDRGRSAKHKAESWAVSLTLLLTRFANRKLETSCGLCILVYGKGHTLPVTSRLSAKAQNKDDRRQLDLFLSLTLMSSDMPPSVKEDTLRSLWSDSWLHFQVSKV